MSARRISVIIVDGPAVLLRLELSPGHRALIVQLQDIYADPDDERMAEFVEFSKISLLEAAAPEREMMDPAGTTFAVSADALQWP
jgi:hypothetical protein